MTDPKNGLTDEEVAERVRLGKINGDPNVKTKSVKQILAGNIFTFFNFINAVLAVLVFLVNSPKNAMFALVIFFNTGIGIFQEIRAKRTIDRLTLVSAPKAHVLRGGSEREIATRELVADDLVLFRTGTQAAADCTVVDGECEVNESLITGESDPVYKSAGEKILSGSFVVSGEAKAVVTALGKDSFTSRITEGVKYVKKQQSRMMDAINLILKGISVCILPIMGLLFYNAILVSEQELDRAVTSTVAAVIGMIPEGLVLLSSVVLAVSAIRLARNQTLVQDLYCIETLARVDTLCLDKTGTITEGKMAVEEVFSFTGKDVDAEMNALAGALPDRNPTFLAVLEKWGKENSPTAEQVLPFSSAKKWSGAYFPAFGSLVMGAGEFILGEAYEAIRQKTEDFSAGGRRVLLLARSDLSFRGRDLPEGLTPLALIAVTDRIRGEAPETLRFFGEQGVDIKIISGDNPLTVSAIAKKAGVKNAERWIDASQLADRAALSAALRDHAVFGRVTPDQKLAIVKALKAAGKTVGMTGDGVNDVLALKEADCSIAMQSGSEAARNVSNLVLLDSNFACMPRVVAEGRRGVNNIERSASLFLSKTLYSLLLAILFMMIRLPFLFEPIQMTLINALCIGAPSFLLALQPNTALIKGSFIGNVMERAVPNGITAVLALSAVIVGTGIFGFSTEQMSSVATVVLAGVSFMITFRCCKPWKRWKAAMMLVLVGGFAGASVLFGGFFGMVSFTPVMAYCAVLIVAASASVMIGLSLLSHKAAAWLRARKAREFPQKIDNKCN